MFRLNVRRENPTISVDIFLSLCLLNKTTNIINAGLFSAVNLASYDSRTIDVKRTSSVNKHPESYQ